MSKKTSTALILKEIRRLFEPPVLTSESLSDYNTMLEYVTECIKPRDFIEQFYVVAAVDTMWDAKRIKLHKALLIERRYQAHQEMEKKRLEKQLEKKLDTAKWTAELVAEAEANKTKQTEPVERVDAGSQPAGTADPVTPVEQVSESTTHSERLRELEAVIDDLRSDIDDILDSPADEFDHARALEAGLEIFAELDRLLSVAMARIEDAFKQIDVIRQLRCLSDDIIEGEFTENEPKAPLIPGPDDDDGEQ